ncbi:MAG: proteasome assembly chaperone family protein [Candidatus Aenigmarchaeota archaeon]|nr:proteasome assembly chaperone family protein [Candidatus Aenigmarchaeota archaeon]
MTTIKKIGKIPKLKNPIFIEGLPGVGNIGRVAAGYLIKELKAKKFAELYSEHFFPFVILHDDFKIGLLKNKFYYYKAKKAGERDIVFMTGDCQSLSPNGHYDVVESVLEFIQKLGVKEMITIGGLATGEIEKKPGIIGAATDDKIIKKYEKSGIDFVAGEKVGYIVGAAGLFLGLGKERGMSGICVLGETSGFPIVTDPKSAESVLNSITKVLKLKVSMNRLEERVKEMEKFIKKVEELQRKALMQISKEERAPVKGKEQLRYIG